jgi:hypothetical protein
MMGTRRASAGEMLSFLASGKAFLALWRRLPGARLLLLVALSLVTAVGCAYETTDEEEEIGISESELPKGVPPTATSQAACFLPGEIENREATLARTELKSCKAPVVTPPVSIEAVGPYKPGNYTRFDCAWTRKDRFARIAINKAVAELVSAADAARNASASDPAVLCVANTFIHWARRDALSRIAAGSNEQPHHVRAWTLGTLGAVYLKRPQVRAAVESAGRGPEVRSWFAQRGSEISRFVRTDGARNNLYYWKGFALTAVGGVTQNANYVAAGHTAFLSAMRHIDVRSSDVRDRGWLPEELERGEKAQSYHAYAAEPLLGTLALSNALGCNFFDIRTTSSASRANQLRFAALLRKTIQGERKANVFEQKTGRRQDSLRDMRGHLVLLGNNAQSRRITTDIESYLRDRGIKLGTSAAGSSRALGGRLADYPAYGSVKITNSTLRRYCAGEGGITGAASAGSDAQRL